MNDLLGVYHFDMVTASSAYWVSLLLGIVNGLTLQFVVILILLAVRRMKFPKPK